MSPAPIFAAEGMMSDASPTIAPATPVAVAREHLSTLRAAKEVPLSSPQPSITSRQSPPPQPPASVNGTQIPGLRSLHARTSLPPGLRNRNRRPLPQTQCLVAHHPRRHHRHDLPRLFPPLHHPHLRHLGPPPPAQRISRVAAAGGAAAERVYGEGA